MYATPTQPLPSDAQLLTELGIRALLWTVSALIVVALAVTWLPQVRPAVCDGTTVLGLPTACALERPTVATLDVLGIRDGKVVVAAGQEALGEAQQSAAQLHDELEQVGAGSSSQVRRSTDGLSDVGTALNQTP